MGTVNDELLSVPQTSAGNLSMTPTNVSQTQPSRSRDDYDNEIKRFAEKWSTDKRQSNDAILNLNSNPKPNSYNKSKNDSRVNTNLSNVAENDLYMYDVPRHNTNLSNAVENEIYMDFRSKPNGLLKPTEMHGPLTIHTEPNAWDLPQTYSNEIRNIRKLFIFYIFFISCDFDKIT